MKKSLIEIVQDVLSDLSSDEVNSIDDTAEAEQVAKIAESVFNYQMANRNWPHLKVIGMFEHGANVSRPTHMQLPDNVKELTYVSYNNVKDEDGSLNYRDVKYLYPDEFLRITGMKNTNTQNVRVVQDMSGVQFVIKDNKPPSYWTSFDDRFIVFDSYDSNIDDALKASKTRIIYYRNPVWRMHDDYIPDMPQEAFPGFIEEIKSYASLNLRQMVNEKAEANSQRQQRWLSRKAWRAHGGVRYNTNFGRRRVK